MVPLSRFCSLLLSLPLLFDCVQSFSASRTSYGLHVQQNVKHSFTTACFLYADDEFLGGSSSFGSHRKDASPLEFSAMDRERFRSIASRQLSQIPVLFLEEALVPKQSSIFRSEDPIVLDLYQYCQTTSSPVAVLGPHPTSRRPLSHGVLCDIHQSPPSTNPHSSSTHTPPKWFQVQARNQRIQILGDSYPFQLTTDSPKTFDSDSVAPATYDYSFELIDCELLEGRIELLTEEERSAAQLLAQQLPMFLEDWFIKTQPQQGDHDDRTLNALFGCIPLYPAQPEFQLQHADALDTMEEAYWNELAMFTAAILSEHGRDHHHSLSLDVRPAMLAAGTPFQRLLLATAAIKNQLQQLE
jgi:hypothetical protein